MQCRSIHVPHGREDLRQHADEVHRGNPIRCQRTPWSKDAPKIVFQLQANQHKSLPRTLAPAKCVRLAFSHIVSLRCRQRRYPSTMTDTDSRKVMRDKDTSDSKGNGRQHTTEPRIETMRARKRLASTRKISLRLFCSPMPTITSPAEPTREHAFFLYVIANAR